MVDIKDYIDVQYPIQTGIVALPPLNKQLFLVDHEDVPIDQRYRYATLSSWDDDLTENEIPYAYSSKWFGQTLKPSELILGRWVSTNSNPYFTSGPALETDYTVWQAIGDGSLRITDGTNEDDVTGISLVGITALDQIPGVLTTAIQAIVTPNVTGLDTSEFEFDTLNRLVLKMSTSGSGAASVYIEAVSPATGTDLAALMDAANGTIQAGLDAETPQAALQAISQLDDTYYNIHLRGESAGQQEALAAWVNTQEKLLDLVTADVECLNPASTTDIAYIVKNLNYGRTKVYYHAESGTSTDRYIDAANTAEPITKDEGAAMYCKRPLTGVTDSGGGTKLTATQINVLEGKYANYAVTYNNGITRVEVDFCGNGVSKRLMHGRDYGVARTRLGIFNYTNTTDLQAFDNDTIAAVEAIHRETMEELLARRVIVDTPDRPIVYNFPDADDIPQVERATHVLSILEAGSAYLNIDVFRYKLYFKFYL